MNDYIKREEAYRRLTEYYHHTRDTQHESLRIALIGIPAEDVAPVRHGRWNVKTWADRNGKPFDEQYAMPIKMFTRWWNNMVDEQARLESKTDKVKVFKVINGVYVEG